MDEALIGTGMLVLLATLWSEWRRYKAVCWQLREGQESAMRELIGYLLGQLPWYQPPKVSSKNPSIGSRRGLSEPLRPVLAVIDGLVFLPGRIKGEDAAVERTPGHGSLSRPWMNSRPVESSSE